MAGGEVAVAGESGPGRVGGGVHGLALTWVQACSSHSCIQVAQFPSGSVAIRLTGSPDLQIFPSLAEWVAFRDGIKNGDFDDLDPVL